MKVLIFILCLTSFVTIYQNCSPQQTSGSSSQFSISGSYPYYNAKPDYFESVQLTKAFEVDGAWKYQFVVGIVYIDDPSKNIDIEVKILDENNDILCPRTTLRVNNSSNHIVIDDCQSGEKAKLAKIEISAKLDTETALEKISEYVFNLK